MQLLLSKRKSPAATRKPNNLSIDYMKTTLATRFCVLKIVRFERVEQCFRLDIWFRQIGCVNRQYQIWPILVEMVPIYLDLHLDTNSIKSRDFSRSNIEVKRCEPNKSYPIKPLALARFIDNNRPNNNTNTHTLTYKQFQIHNLWR